MTRRVLLLVSVLDGGGPGRVMATLAQELLESGIEPLLVATHGPTDSSLIEQTRSAGVTVTNLSMGSMSDLGAPIRLSKLVRRWRPDVVHTRTVRADLLGRIATLHGVPVVNNIVNLYPDDCLVRLGPVVGRGVMTFARATQRASRLFVANAAAIAANAVAAFGISRERVEVVYDGVSIDRWIRASPADLSSEGIAATDTVCLTVARLHPQKGLENLIAAAGLLEDSRLRFAVAGEGPDRASLEHRVRVAGLEDRVVFLGHRDDIPNLMARADLFVLPSRFEGLPSAVIEAMAAGLAVVASATAGIPELVTPGITGFLVSPAQPASLAEGIRAGIMSDRKALGQAARERAQEMFSAEAMARGFVDVYERVARSRRYPAAGHSSVNREGGTSHAGKAT